MKIKIDSEIRDLITPLSTGERESLESLLIADGCREPVVLWKEQGILLDGHHRKEICERRKIDFKTSELSFPDRNTAMLWVIRNQFGRRNLTDYQRAELALRLEPLLAAQAEARMRAGQKTAGNGKAPDTKVDPRANLPEGRARDELGQIARVGSRTVDKVKSIQANAAEPIQQLAREGRISVDAAAHVSTLPKAEQRQIAKQGPTAVREAASEIREQKQAKSDRELPEKDLAGREIKSAAMRKVFADAQAFDRLATAISSLNKELNFLCGDGNGRKERLAGFKLAKLAEKFRPALETFRQQAKFARPFAVCPGPHEEGKRCLKCKSLAADGGEIVDQLGFLVESQWQQVPKDERK